MLVLSAAVGEGHDAAAHALAGQLRRADAVVEVADGLVVLGPRLARFVVGAYRLQLRRAAWSWALLYAVSRNRLALRVAGYLLALHGGRRLVLLIDAHAADAVVSTYPLVSATLASLRRRGRLRIPCASLITDFDPHPGWSHPDLDVNLGVAAGRGITVVAPPIRTGPGALEPASAARDRLGLPPSGRVALVCGGAWGIGAIAEAARAIVAVDGLHLLVVTGRNRELEDALGRELAGRAATVLGYVDGLGALIAAADVVVQHAGGVTCLEAFAAGRPVVMFDPLAGHGRRNAALMAAAGLAAVAATAPALRALLESERFWRSSAPGSVAQGQTLFVAPAAGAVLLDRISRGVTVRAHAPGRLQGRRPLLAVALVLVLALLCAGWLGDPDMAGWALSV